MCVGGFVKKFKVRGMAFFRRVITGRDHLLGLSLNLPNLENCLNQSFCVVCAGDMHDWYVW